MAINSRQVQTQAQQQVQTLSPQQILAVKLLELPTVELEERIHSELLDNPALEEGKEHTEEAEGHEDDYPADENEESGTDYNDDLSLGDYRTELVTHITIMLQIYCKNNNLTKDFPEGSTLLDIYNGFNLEMPYGPVSAKVNNKVEGLNFKVYYNKDVEFLDITNPSGISKLKPL
jgi:hypothetical protein